MNKGSNNDGHVAVLKGAGNMERVENREKERERMENAKILRRKGQKGHRPPGTANGKRFQFLGRRRLRSCVDPDLIINTIMIMRNGIMDAGRPII